MNDDEIAKARALCGAATGRGEWIADAGRLGMRDQYASHEDATFLNAARTLLPQALDALEEARRENEALAEQCYETWTDMIQNSVERCGIDYRLADGSYASPIERVRMMSNEVLRLRATVEKLRAMLERGTSIEMPTIGHRGMLAYSAWCGDAARLLAETKEKP